MELPLFYGEKAREWIDECEAVFTLTGITQDAKVKWAHAHIQGKAKTWLASTKINTYLLNWIQLCELICDRFPASGEHDSMEQFQQLKQVTTVSLYIDTFETYMIQMQRDHPYLTEIFFCFDS